MNRRLLLLLAAAAVVAGLLAFDGGPQSDVVEAVERGVPAQPAAGPGGNAAVTRDTAPEPIIARLIPRAELAGEDGDAINGGEMVFGTQGWNPPPPAPSAEESAAAAAAAAPPPPPSAPPLPFTYLGKANEGGVWEVYLARTDKTYIVKQGTVIDVQYRVDTITPPNLTLTYLPLNQVQTLNIGVLE